MQPASPPQRSSWILLAAVLSILALILLYALTQPPLPVPSYQEVILSDAPLLYWRLGEKVGDTVADASGNGYGGTIEGSVTLGVPGAIARDPDTAIAFDGNSGYIRGEKPVPVGPDFTIEAWVKASRRDGSGTVVSLNSADRQSRTLYLEDGRFQGRQDLSETWTEYAVLTMAIDPLVWHHVVFTVENGVTLSLYLDGVRVATRTVPQTELFNALPFVAWTTWPFYPKFAGVVDEVALYPRALPAERIQAHYLAGRDGGHYQPRATPVAPAEAVRVPTAACELSLQAMVDAAAPGSVVIVPPCIYRETVTITKPLVLIGQPGAEIRGSDVWATGWIRAGPYWVHAGAPDLPTQGECEPGTSRCLWPHQVFFDGWPLVQVAARPRPGQFAVERGRVVLADDPTGHVVEVTTRQYWVIGGADNVTIQGFRMRHAGTPAQHGALTTNGHSNWTIQDNILSDAHAAVVDLRGGSGHRLLRNDISRGGQQGVTGSEGSDVVVQGNRIYANNTEEFKTEWEAGGLKFALMRSVLIEGNEVYGNIGPGLWCDIDCTDVVIRANRIYHNTKQGIVYEISHYGRIHGNAVWENGWAKPVWGWGAGILCQNCDHTEIFENTVAWNADGIIVISAERHDSRPVVGNYVHNNVIILGNGDVTGLGWLQDWAGELYAPASNNRGARNRYWFAEPEGSQERFEWNARGISRLADFNVTPGENEGRYLTRGERDAALLAAGIPLAPVVRHR